MGAEIKDMPPVAAKLDVDEMGCEIFAPPNASLANASRPHVTTHLLSLIIT